MQRNKMMPKLQGRLFCAAVCWILLFVGYCEGQEQNCNNAFFTLIRVQGMFFRRLRTCWWVRRDTSRCDVINFSTNQKVGFTCAVECPNVSGCGVVSTPSVPTIPTGPTVTSPTTPTTITIPTTPTTPASPPSAPIVVVTPPTTPTTVTIPTRPTTPVSPPFAPIIVVRPTTPPLPTVPFPPYPSGPYITIERSSELVTIPRPPTNNILITNNDPSTCPHFSTGLKRWHDASTWPSGTIPASTGQDVTLPPSTRVLIDQSIIPNLGVITVPSSSELIFGTNAGGININVVGIMVNGRLTAGSENCRMTTPITITLRGTRPNNAVTNIPTWAYKGIIVSGLGSQISLHGKHYYQTWTRLSKTVNIDERVIILQERVNWQIGQRIVIITSSLKDSRDNNENEIHTISNINYNPPNGIGTIVYLTEPMKYKHIANSLYQVEVGLLSRTITIQGAENDSEPTDPDPNNCTGWYGRRQPCMNKQLTGYGGHMRIENDGIGQVSGIELYRMGQTNVLGRYPIHFHLLENCPTCYVRSSSIHHSFYRCIAIHGTHNVTISENVAYDVTGYCYYLEDGVEKDNTISYNLAAHIHTIGPDLPRADGQEIPVYSQSNDLTLPADVTASGFYITNIHNNIIGNAASGGWAGFAFPNLIKPLQTFKDSGYRPLFESGLIIDGNTAHSTGWWWFHGSAFYLGGDLYYNNSNPNQLVYNAGRGRIEKSPCKKDPCLPNATSCEAWLCSPEQQLWLRITNTKTFLNYGVGLNSWTGRGEVIGYESHDSGLGLEALSAGFWLDNALIVCRTGESLGSVKPNDMKGNGFVWYDTDQNHIITRATFRNCGYLSDLYNQYDNSPSRGCGENNTVTGCHIESSVFGFMTHSDQFTPEVMQGTRAIKFENCGRRFLFSHNMLDSVSARAQNWVDADGSVSGLRVPTLIGSGLWSVKDWWGVDPRVVYEPQAPLRFIAKNDGPKRNIAHITLRWDASLHSQVGSSLCNNGNGAPCPWEGFIRHAGKMFTPNQNNVNNGMPLTARGDIVGPTGGYGWIINFNRTAPRFLEIREAEIHPDTILVISIPYPINTRFTITAKTEYCWAEGPYICDTVLQLANSIDEVRLGDGNKYFVDNNGVVSFRVIQTATMYTRNPNWTKPDYSTPPRFPADLWSLPRFERGGVLLPGSRFGKSYQLQAICPNDNSGSPTTGYCPESIPTPRYDPEVCPEWYKQTAYDKCCQSWNLTNCMFSDGTRNF